MKLVEVANYLDYLEIEDHYDNFIVMLFLAEKYKIEAALLKEKTSIEFIKDCIKVGVLKKLHCGDFKYTGYRFKDNVL